jgi:8-oxo-dGTP diphosphatase
MLIEDAQGNQLLALQRLDEAELCSLVPLTHALVVARHRGRQLLVFNRRRQYWERAGGMIDPGETARACAARELAEESGVVCANDALRWVGAMKFLLQPTLFQPSVRIEYGALYAAEVDNPAAFLPNEEISRVCWWDGVESIGEIARIDQKLLEFA